MKYGFIIDNRKCIGCHACTTACKSEHDVAVGVNRTYVKQVEKGEFPNTRRIFSVMRCNHCTDAPCVEICPVEALYTREDGIVDFDNNRCIGCKSCMQACPYDALYIDPDNNTAAKCNYCSHRVEVGREPACVTVCPEHAIIAGDMHNPETEISQLLARQAVKVRKPEKGTNPNLFYIDGDDASLIPEATDKSGPGLWNSQARGVGHFAKAAEKMLNTNDDVDLLQMTIDNDIEAAYQRKDSENPNYIDVLTGKARRVYDTPDKGILWGWEVSAYVFTKAIAAGAFLIPFIAIVLGYEVSSIAKLWSAGISLVGLALTGLFLVMDLDRPDRFLNVLLRPQWNSWLVKGGYIISIFGLLVTIWAAMTLFEIKTGETILVWGTAVFAVLLAVYTAFLFAQAKGRDFWQSPTLPLHMLVHSVMAGASIFVLAGLFLGNESWMHILVPILSIALVTNLFTLVTELTITHPTTSAKKVVSMIIKGRYRNLFWIVSVIVGNIIPLVFLMLGNSQPLVIGSAVFVLIGIVATEKIWVEAPQRIPLA
ncbi:Fe-S-cluster-containing dehydrogenase component [Lutibacter agarilyticus]|uniref:Fe-S-cluster-containing dehydrogenase component n=1 Tax=Lutibacter agarilyticus TaxID=1109740 RepID=A0A238VSF5_9FLAO|nr:4Fe-4S dicluster domain-containing protein [Lutibacter agarilyticus]SNR37156.1 Fe-S-cluster-containing dehydrogenase component [Lutibacter agarilyticus]